MLKRKFFIIMILFTWLTKPLYSSCIKYDVFVTTVFKHSYNLSKKSAEYLSEFLESIANSSSTITFNCKFRKKIVWRSKNALKRFKNNHNKCAALVELVAVIKDQNFQDEIEQSKLSCPVCFEALTIKRQGLPCSHAFCKDCLITWFAQDKPDKSGGHTACPVCRDELPLNIKRDFMKTALYRKILSESLKKKDSDDWEELRREQEAEDLGLYSFSIEEDEESTEFDIDSEVEYNSNEGSDDDNDYGDEEGSSAV